MACWRSGTARRPWRPPSPRPWACRGTRTRRREASRSKLRTRQRLRDAGLPVPDFGVIASEQDLAAWSDRGPVVVKPVGAVRQPRRDSRRHADRATPRLGAREPPVGATRHPRAARSRRRGRAGRDVHPGAGIRRRRGAVARPPAGAGDLRQARPALRPVLRGDAVRLAVAGVRRRCSARSTAAVDAACRALGLSHGPIHAECRVNDLRRLRPGGRRAAHWRHLRAGAPLHGTQRHDRDARGAPAAPCDRRARGPLDTRVRRQRRDDDSHPRPRRPARRWTAPTARAPCRASTTSC